MNGTNVLYEPGEQAMISLSALVLCPLFSALVYYLARRRSMKVTESLKSRAYVFYRYISGLLLGQVLCHTEWGSSSWVVLCVAAGYFLMDSAENVGRVWNDNIYFSAPADYEVTGELGLDREQMELHDVMVSNDFGGDSTANDTFEVEQDYKDMRKRQWMLGTLIALLWIISLMDGFLLVTRSSETQESPLRFLMILSFTGAVSSMSLAVYGSMVHAKYHLTEDAFPRIMWWIGVTALWCIGMFLSSCLPVLCGIQFQLAQAIVTHSAFVVIYGVAAGALLKIQYYFHCMKQKNVDRWDTFVGIVVFFSALAQSAGTSILL